MELNENVDPQPDLHEEEEMVEELRPELESEEEVTALFQAIVFASSDLVTVAKVATVIEGFDLLRARNCMAKTNEQLLSINSPFEMVEQGGGFRFRTRAKWAPWVRSVLASEGQSRRLSQAALETLAIVAYKQPITKVEIETIRGVSCSGPIKTLLDRKLIALGGRAETLGNPLQYITTRDFLLYFGINKIPDDLPRLYELEDLIRASELLPPLRTPEPLEQRFDDDQLQLPMDD
jgi:segregation and condensation protein B